MNKITTYAPIMVSVYNREIHFRKCIESLRECFHAEQSHLFVAIDAPYRKEDIEANSRIVEYCKTINGFKEVTLFIREKNLGASNNRGLARTEIFKTYDRLIMFEDDNVFAKDFLHYLNLGLETYKDRSDIFSISGYNFPVRMPSSYTKNSYLWQCYSAWGVGVWRDKMLAVELVKNKALNIIRSFLRNIREVYQLNKVSNHYVPALLLMLKSGAIHGDGYLSLYLFKNRMYTVFPVVSRVRNTGHDGSGFIVAMEDDIYGRQDVYEGDLDYDFDEKIGPDPAVSNILKENFKRSTFTQCKTFIKVVLTNFGIINSRKDN